MHNLKTEAWKVVSEVIFVLICIIAMMATVNFLSIHFQYSPNAVLNYLTSGGIAAYVAIWFYRLRYDKPISNQELRLETMERIIRENLDLTEDDIRIKERITKKSLEEDRQDVKEKIQNSYKK